MVKSPIHMRVWTFAYFLITFALVPSASSFKPMVKLNRQMALGLEVTSKGFDLTDSLKSHIDKKIGDIVKSLKNEAVSSHVHIKANNGFSQPGGRILHAKQKSEDLISTVDAVSHKIKTMLHKHFERSRSKSRRNRKLGSTDVGLYAEDEKLSSSYSPDLPELTFTELDQKYRYVDKPLPDELELVREKEFLMPPMSVKEALSALELMDHPFYLFRNKKTNEVNLVYKRDDGGAGHIAPHSKV